MVEDRQESQLPDNNDCEWVRALDNNGNSIKVSKSDLLKDMFQEKGNVTSDLDNYKTSGIYGINAADYNVGVITYGMLIVFSGLKIATGGGGYPIVQIVINAYHPAVVMKIRIYWINTWSTWKTISLT